MNEKEKDGELFSLIWMTAIFGGVLIGVSLFYSAWDEMGVVWKTIGYICLIGNAALAIIIFAKMNDPVYDKYRIIFCIMALLTTIYIGGFRVASNETVKSDSNTKQEQLK